jgi:hypothetical protein
MSTYRIEIMATFNEVTLAIQDLSIAINDATKALLVTITTEADTIAAKIEELGNDSGDPAALDEILASVQTIKDTVGTSTTQISTAVQALVPPDATPLEGVAVVPTPDNVGLPDSPAIVANGAPDNLGAVSSSARSASI